MIIRSMLREAKMFNYGYCPISIDVETFICATINVSINYIVISIL